MADIEITDAMVEAFRWGDSGCDGPPGGWREHGDGCCERAGLAAVVPLLWAEWEAKRGCVLCHPGTPEQIDAREAASARLDALIERDEVRAFDDLVALGQEHPTGPMPDGRAP